MLACKEIVYNMEHNLYVVDEHSLFSLGRVHSVYLQIFRGLLLTSFSILNNSWFGEKAVYVEA